jgi:ribosomal protein L11 methyltransferase
MDYIKVAFRFVEIEDYQQDLLIAALGDVGFDTFEEAENGFDGFIIANQFEENNLKEVLSHFKDDFETAYTVHQIQPENWNEEWEKNFSPLIISDECYVRATFHEHQPQYQYEIVIDPKMAFGTGHHQTTTMVMRFILAADLNGKVVLDMGAGTGILGILAAKKGATTITAIDNDEVCYRSAIENAALNGINNLTSLCGSKETIPAMAYDIILANINRNILLDQLEDYANVVKKNGSIFLSGFYENPDLAMIQAHCSKLGLTYTTHQKIGEWVAAHFLKTN